MAKKVKSKSASKKSTQDTSPKVSSPRGSFKGKTMKVATKTNGSAKKAPAKAAVKSSKFIKQIHAYGNQKDCFLDDVKLRDW